MFDSKNLIILFIILAALNMFSGSFDLKNTLLMLPRSNNSSFIT